MKKLINGRYEDLTVQEISAAEDALRANAMAVSYDEAVDVQIRMRYSASQEFSILRQKDEKPEEYAAYYAYCEACKAQVKQLYTE